MSFLGKRKRVNRQQGRICLNLLGLVILFALAACAPSQVSRREGQVGAPVDPQVLERFEEAQQLASRQAYGDAVAIYQAYLDAHPKGPLADRALMETGLVYMAAGKYEDARQAFELLLRRFRKSPFASDARYHTLLAYYTEGDYDTAVAFGKSALKKAGTAAEAYPINNLLGYVYGAMGAFPEAFESYMSAYAQSDGEKQSEILSRVKEVISNLNEEDLRDYIEQYGDRVPGGYLRLRLSEVYASEDLIEDAIVVLHDFQTAFPRHEDMPTADAMLEELYSRTRVDPHLVGCILPLSGRYATFGNRALTGIELALDEMNATPDMHPVQIVIRDSMGEPGHAVAALEELVLEEGVVAVIGPMVTSEPVAHRAEALRVPIITLTQKSGITTVGDYVFRNFLTLSLQVKALVEYAVQDLGIQKCAIFYPEETYGINFMNRFWDELTLQGAEVVGIESYAPDQTDFRDSINRLVGLYYPRAEERDADLSDEKAIWDKLLEVREFEKEWTVSQQVDLSADMALDDDSWEDGDGPEPVVDFEAIFIPDSFDKVGLIVPQLKYHDIMDVLLLGTNLWHSDMLLEIARSYVQGAIIPDGFFADSPSSDVQMFVDSYRSVFGDKPGFLEAQAYDVARILFEAANDSDVRSRLTLMKYLKGLEAFYGITGATSFDETGDVQKDLFLLTIEGRQFVQIKP